MSTRNVGDLQKDHGLTADAGHSQTSPSPKPAWILKAQERLRQLGTLSPGWDSYSGQPMALGVHFHGDRLLGLLEIEDLPVPGVVLCSGGSVQFEWRLQGRELEIEVFPTGCLGYLKAFPDGQMEEGQMAQQFPEQLRRLTQWVARG